MAMELIVYKDTGYSMYDDNMIVLGYPGFTNQKSLRYGEI
jgi:hypothetical protein